VKGKVKSLRGRGCRGEESNAQQKTKEGVQRPGWLTFISSGDRDHI